MVVVPVAEGSNESLHTLEIQVSEKVGCNGGRIKFKLGISKVVYKPIQEPRLRAG